MDHGSHRLHLMVVALLLCLLLPDLIPGGAAPAQFTQSNQGQQAEPAKPETPAPAAIPVAEVSIRAQEVARRLESFAKLAEPDPDLAKIREDLGVFEDSLETRKQRPGFQELEQLGERRLEDLATEWKRYESGVKKWETSLLAKSEELNDQMLQMDQLEVVWAVTRDTARAQRAPRAVTRQIGSTLEEIGGTKAMMEKRFREILALQELVAAGLRVLKDDADHIKSQREERRQRLFVRDAPPLWEAIAAETDSSRVVAAVSSTWIRNITTTVDFYLANLDRVLLHIVLALVIFAFLLFLRKQMHTLGLTPEEGTTSYSLRLLAYPGASALLVTIFLTFFLYPNRPVAVSDLALLLMLFPILRLSLGLVRGDVRILMWTLALVYATDLTQKILSADATASRLIVLLEAAIGLGLCVWAYRPKSQFRLGHLKGARRIIHLILPFALLLLAGSLVANIVGSVTLARRLASGVVDSSTVAVALSVVAILFDGVLVASVRGWLGKISRAIQKNEHVVTERLSSLVHLAAFILWANATLRAFGLYEPLRQWADVALFEKWGLGTVQISVIDVLLFFGVLIGAFMLTRIVGLFLEEDVFGRIRLPRGVPGAVAMVVRYTLAGFGILLALAALGINLGEFGLLAGALGVGLGFGLQNIVANFVSGVILAFERPIQKGDMIQFGTLWGTVSGIGVRATTVRSFDQSEVIIPNNDLITKQVTNWTLSDRRRRLDLPVKVAFGSDPRKVMEIMLKVAEEHPLTLEDQKPFAIFGGFGEHYIEFTLYFFIRTENFLVAKNEVGFNVLDALEEAGIQMPTPKRRLLMDTPAQTTKRKPRAKKT
jgi:small-conductance mechanosensitive channel